MCRSKIPINTLSLPRRVVAVRCKGQDDIILNSSINSAAFIENKNSGVMHCMSGSFLAKLQPFEGLA